MKVIILLLTTVTVFADVQSGPYKPSGWKPQGARLELPTEYGAPFRKPANLVNQVTFTTEATTETDLETTTFDRGYLPPDTTTVSTDDEDRGDPRFALPGQDPPLTFTRFGGVQPPQSKVDQAPQQEQQAARFSELEDFKTQFFASQHQLQFQPRNGQLRLAVNNNRQNRLGKLEEQAPVQQQYGAPVPVTTISPNKDEKDQVEEISEDEKPQQESSEEEEENNEESAEEAGAPSIAVANAGQTGQYYILAPDNTLQKVQFRTVQTEEDRINHGFTAQLRYQPVEPVKPPVYGYNEQGMLIRIYRK